MGKAKKLTKTWCMLRDSLSLREAIFFRLKEKNITIYRICKDLGMDPRRMYSYRSSNNNMVRPTQFDVFRICRYLDIKLSLNIEIDEQ